MSPPVVIQDFSKICRCCMEVANYDLFKTFFENQPLSKILATCTSIKVGKSDQLPKNICQPCLQQLVSSYLFNQKVLKMQNAILEISRVLDKAKLKKEIIGGDHDYEIGQPKIEQLDEDEIEANENPSSGFQLSPVKMEIDRGDYIDNEMEMNFPDTIREGKLKNHGEVDQDFWFEDENEGLAEGNMGTYNGVFDPTKLINSQTKYIMEDSNEAQYQMVPRKKSHICQVCNEGFYTIKELNIHSEENNHPQKFCGECYEFFHSYSELIKHCMETGHARPQLFKCPYCFKKFEDRKLMTVHMNGHMKKRNSAFAKDRTGVHSCTICRASFDDGIALRKHLKENEISHMMCSICSRRFTSFSKLQTHLKVHAAEKPYECTECGLRFNVKSNMERHCMIHSGERPYVCGYCSKGFIHKTSLLQHEKTHHQVLDSPYLCSFCGQMFPSAVILKKHMSKHKEFAEAKGNQTPLECNLCGKTLSCKATLYSHIRNVHDRVQKVYPCVFCGKVLKTKTSLEFHVNYHTGNCPYKCDVCGKAFTNATTLKGHSLIHTDERPYSCHICSKSFKQKPHLNTHILTIHTGLKPFSCSYCDKTFALNGNLSQHLKTHTGYDSPFVCTICNKAFYFASRLRKHEKIHLK